MNLENKKVCLFTCGNNLNEHENEFDCLKNNKDVITVCYKSAIEKFNYACDIFITDFRRKNLKYDKITSQLNIYVESFENDFKTNTDAELAKIKFNLIISSSKKESILPMLGKENLINYKFDENVDGFFFTNKPLVSPFLKCFPLLSYLNAKEIYVFGMFNSENNSLLELLNKNPHFNSNSCVRTKESPDFYNDIATTFLAKWCEHNNVNVYNVSKLGSVSNEIKRIETVKDIFNKDRKYYIKENHIDLLKQFTDALDKDYYRTKYDMKKYNFNMENQHHLDPYIHNYFGEGIYRQFNLNKTMKNNEIYIKDDIFLNIFYLVQRSVSFIVSPEIIYLVHGYHKLKYLGYNIIGITDLDKIVNKMGFENKGKMLYQKNKSKYTAYLKQKKLVKNDVLYDNIDRFMTLEIIYRGKGNYNLL